MKIRIKGNSLRIRISKTEVDDFCKNGHLEERTEFGGNTFCYSLERAGNEGELNADFANGTITMFVPGHLVKDWDTNNTVGFSHNKPLPAGGSLFLLLEKDFKCIDSSVPEDQSDNYDNPLQTCA